MSLNAAQNFKRQLVRAPPKESQDRSCRKLTRFRHAPFHTCYLYPVHLWPGSCVNWGLTFRKHRKYDINTPRLCPRDARDLSLAHFPASIYPGKTPPPASSHHAATHASITKKGNHTWEKLSSSVMCHWKWVSKRSPRWIQTSSSSFQSEFTLVGY